ncbi:MAG TPA: HdeD family acid-resistance protein [Gemmatimonadaceae bacterium]|nr:HdeD family acid-resistance protein [Gemmatimonadaceae bacterium]
MVEMLTRNWGWVVLRGVVAIMFGALTLLRPEITLAMLLLLFGAYALVDGAFMAVSAIANRHDQPRWGTLLLGGLLGMAVGIATFMVPGLTAFTLVMLIAAWAIVMGLTEIVAAVRLRKVITGEWMFIIAGVLAVVFGVVVFAAPITGALAVAMWIGIYALVSGVVLVALGFRLRSWGRMHHAL